MNLGAGTNQRRQQGRSEAAGRQKLLTRSPGGRAIRHRCRARFTPWQRPRRDTLDGIMIDGLAKNPEVKDKSRAREGDDEVEGLFPQARCVAILPPQFPAESDTTTPEGYSAIGRKRGLRNIPQSAIGLHLQSRSWKPLGAIFLNPLVGSYPIARRGQLRPPPPGSAAASLV